MTTKLYPAIVEEVGLVDEQPMQPSAPPLDLSNLTNVQTFRLEEIRKVRTQIESDIQKYSRCRRRYSGAYSGINYVSTGLNVINAVEAAASVGLLVTGIGIPISIGLGVAAGLSSVMSVLLGVINTKVSKKLEKHDLISSLAIAKLTSMNLIISKALEDTQITDQEFVIIQRDFEEYKKLKHDIQSKSRSAPVNVEEIKKKLLEEGRLLGRKEQLDALKKKLGASE